MIDTAVLKVSTPIVDLTKMAGDAGCQRNIIFKSSHAWLLKKQNTTSTTIHYPHNNALAYNAYDC